jgi:TRAP-type C4-dicarboxylate transport system permease small subunit
MDTALLPAATPRTPVGVRRFVAAWHKAECWLAVSAFAFIALVLVLDVAGRELLGPLLGKLGIQAGATGVFGAQKMAVYALVVATYGGVGIAAATGRHLVPRIAFRIVPAAWSAAMDRLADTLTGLLLLGTAWYGLVFVDGSIATGLRAPMLQWPVWPFQLAIPLGLTSAALHYLCFASWPGLRPAPPAFQE